MILYTTKDLSNVCVGNAKFVVYIIYFLFHSFGFKTGGSILIVLVVFPRNIARYEFRFRVSVFALTSWVLEHTYYILIFFTSHAPIVCESASQSFIIWSQTTMWSTMNHSDLENAKLIVQFIKDQYNFHFLTLLSGLKISQILHA